MNKLHALLFVVVVIVAIGLLIAISAGHSEHLIKASGGGLSGFHSAEVK